MTSPVILPTPPPSVVSPRQTGILSITNSAVTPPSLIRLTAVRPPLRFLLSPAAFSTPPPRVPSSATSSSPAIPPRQMLLLLTSSPLLPVQLISSHLQLLLVLSPSVLH